MRQRPPGPAARLRAGGEGVRLRRMADSQPLDIRPAGQGCLLRVRAKPNAAASRIIGGYGGALKLSVKEAPERGRANEAVCRLLASLLGLPAGFVTLVSGGGSQDKTVRIDGIGPDECRRHLQDVLDHDAAGP
jgi:uncharacterized protein